jgi:hypothetical protein
MSVMSQLVKTKRQANFKDFKRFGAFKGLVEQKRFIHKLHRYLILYSVLVGQKSSLWHEWAFKTHECHKEPNLHTNSLNKLLFSTHDIEISHFD